MFFSPFLASRYLKPKRTFLSIITVISVVGVALGIWAMIVVISVFTGYGEKVKNSILGFDPHLVIDNGGFTKNWYEVCEKVKTVPGIKSATPFVQGQVVMDFKGLRSAPTIRGILPPTGSELELLSGKIAKGPDPDDPSKLVPRGKFFGENDFYSAVIGVGLATSLNIQIGDTILLHSTRDVNAIMKMVDQIAAAETEDERKRAIDSMRDFTAPQECTVTGIFDSGYWEYDTNVVFVHLETAQILYQCDIDECHGIAARTEDPFKVNQYQDQLHTILPEQFRVRTWAQMQKIVFDAIAAERQAMFLILFIIMIVGSFGIMSTMITVTVQKRTEIGLLKALGSKEGQIAWVFLFQGMFVGLIGCLIGLGLAQLTLWQRNNISQWIGKTFGVDIFSAEIYGVAGGLPAVQTPRDLFVITLSAFVCCTLAALLPALIAAFLQPAKALRSQ